VAVKLDDSSSSLKRDLLVRRKLGGYLKVYFCGCSLLPETRREVDLSASPRHWTFVHLNLSYPMAFQDLVTSLPNVQRTLRWEDLFPSSKQ